MTVSVASYPLEAIRREFAGLGNRVYLDICARAPLPAATASAITDYLRVCVAEGARKEEWLAHIEAVRARMGQLLGAAADDIAYTKATSEGVNAFAHGLHWRPGDNVVLTPTVEHANNLYPWLHLRELGVEIRFAHAENGRILPEHVATLVDERTRVVVAAHVGFNTGARAGLRQLAEVAHRVDAVLFVDAAQSLGLLDLDVRELGVDALAACVHKGLLAPYGLGILYCRKELAAELNPVYMARAGVDLDDPREYVVGDLNDVKLVPTARRFEFGSYNFPAIFGLGASLNLLLNWNCGRIEQHVLTLSAALTAELQRLEYNVASPTGDAERSHIVCVRRDDADELAALLEQRQIRVSARLGILRIGIGPFTSQSDLERLVSAMRDIAPPRAPRTAC